MHKNWIDSKNAHQLGKIELLCEEIYKKSKMLFECVYLIKVTSLMLVRPKYKIKSKTRIVYCPSNKYTKYLLGCNFNKYDIISDAPLEGILKTFTTYQAINSKFKFFFFFLQNLLNVKLTDGYNDQVFTTKETDRIFYKFKLAYTKTLANFTDVECIISLHPTSLLSQSFTKVFKKAYFKSFRPTTTEQPFREFEYIDCDEYFYKSDFEHKIIQKLAHRVVQFQKSGYLIDTRVSTSNESNKILFIDTVDQTQKVEAKIRHFFSILLKIIGNTSMKVDVLQHPTASRPITEKVPSKNRGVKLVKTLVKDSVYRLVIGYPSTLFLELCCNCENCIILTDQFGHEENNLSPTFKIFDLCSDVPKLKKVLFNTAQKAPSKHTEKSVFFVRNYGHIYEN